MKLVKIENYEKQDEYWDIEIENTNCFYANNILIHNSNSGCSLDDKGELLVLSRKRVIDINHDNAGFAAFVKKNEDTIRDFFTPFSTCLEHIAQKVVIYGEWCGSGIQKGVAINQLDKMWVIFAVKIVPKDEEQEAYYVECNGIESPEDRIFNINTFKTYQIDIDFSDPSKAQNKMIEYVAEVEKQCPVGKYFGVDGIGEGIVWSHWVRGKRIHIFKTKGEKHTKGGGSKVKTLKPVDEAFEQKKIDFVNNHACKLFRLDQMYTEVFDLNNGGKGDIKKTGDYIKAVIQDVAKEEDDILANQGLIMKDVNKLISQVARNYMMDRLNKEAGI